MSTPSARRLVAFALLACTSLPAVADDVFLKNGRSFESVIVVARTDDAIRIRLPYGEISLPRTWIESVVEGATPLDEYLVRRDRLSKDAEASAREWLDLAVWAREHELDHGYREAALEAAGIAPDVEGLAQHMRRLDFVFENELDRWISYEESQRRAGLERYQGEWMSRQEADRRRAAHRPESRAEQRLSTTTEERLGSAIEALAIAELERERRETERERSRSYERGARTVYHVPFRHAAVYPVSYFPAGFVRLPRVEEESEGTEREDGGSKRGVYDSLRRRQPGSLLVTGSSSRGVGSLAGVRRQPGSLALRTR